MMQGSMNIKNTAVLRVYHFEIDQGGLPEHSILKLIKGDFPDIPLTVRDKG
jgi:hypothetical protein